MSEKSVKLLEESLALPAKERAGLADALLSSLEPPADVDVEQAWKEEVERRIQALDKGQAQVISWDQVRDELWSDLGASRQR